MKAGWEKALVALLLCLAVPAWGKKEGYCPQLLAIPIAEQEPIDVDEDTFAAWDTEDFERHLGLSHRFHIPQIATLPQVIVRADRLPRDYRILARKLLMLSVARRYVNTLDILDAQMARDEYLVVLRMFQEENLRAGLVTEETLAESATRQSGLGTVEVAAWRIMLKTGRVIAARHTSRLNDGVTPADATAALGGVLKKQGLTLADVVSLEWWHSHPGEAKTVLLLSAVDQAFAQGVRHMLDAMAAEQVPFVIRSVYGDPRGAMTLTTLTP